MSVSDPAPTSTASLVSRVQGILMSPRAEWDKIDVEPATAQGLFLNYVCILAAIPAIASLVGGLVFGVSLIFVTVHLPVATVVESAILGYAVSLVSVYVLALVVDALAPSFDGQKNQIQALKVAAYAGTAGWVGGVVAVLPMIAPLAIIAGLYGLYILFLGLPKLMKVPQEKAIGYVIVSIIVDAVLMGVTSWAASLLLHPSIPTVG